jgi:deazaflavin-dependent oxidoreductase (nitroreductase family)
MSDWNTNIIEEFRENGGTVTTGGFGRRLVLLHSRGARSGAQRVNPLASVRESDDAWLVAASAAGADRHPAWFHNLLAHPEVTIETPDDGTVDVLATDLEGAERDAGWDRFTQMSEGFRAYEAKTSRTIPVVRLTRR